MIYFARLTENKVKKQKEFKLDNVLNDFKMTLIDLEMYHFHCYYVNWIVLVILWAL